MGRADADGTIKALAFEAESLTLSVSVDVGERYQLQCSTNIVIGAWENIGTAVQATTTETNLIVNASAKACSFRVVMLDDPIGPTGGPPTSPPPMPTGY